MNRPDVLVVGGGIVGITIAYHLAGASGSRTGKSRVVLCERRAIGSGTSSMSGAMCGQQAEINSDITSLSHRALEIYANFDAHIGGTCGFFQHGILGLFESEAAADERVRRACADGSNALRVARAEIREIYPQVETSGRPFGVFFPDTGCVDAFATMHSFAAGARSRGVELREFDPVVSMQTEGRRITRVKTASESFEPGTVVLACGPWSPEVAALAGVTLPITPTMQGISFFRQPPETFDRPPVLTAELAIIPWHGGLFRVLRDTRNPLVYASPDPTDAACPQWMIDHTKEVIEARLPVMKRGRFQGAYRTCYDDTPDLKPLIGFTPEFDNLFLDCGWSGRGFKFSVAIGELIARWIGGDPPELDLSPWMADRTFTA